MMDNNNLRMCYRITCTEQEYKSNGMRIHPPKVILDIRYHSETKDQDFLVARFCSPAARKSFKEMCDRAFQDATQNGFTWVGGNNVPDCIVLFKRKGRKITTRRYDRFLWHEPEEEL